MWAQRSPTEALEVLRQPDVTVTNASDKREHGATVERALRAMGNSLAARWDAAN